jgi:hypothetical protein
MGAAATATSISTNSQGDNHSVTPVISACWHIEIRKQADCIIYESCAVLR